MLNENTNSARAFESGSCYSTNLKLKTNQSLLSDETRDRRLDFLRHQVRICLLLIQLPLLLTTCFFHDNKGGFFQTWQTNETIKKYTESDTTILLCYAQSYFWFVGLRILVATWTIPLVYTSASWSNSSAALLLWTK